MRRLLVILLFTLSLTGFSQFDLTNQFGFGINVPVIVAARDFPPFPIVQLDFKHEFYFGTRNPSIDKSMEVRLGLGFVAFPSTSLYILNLGIQRSFVETQYLHALGVDLIGFALPHVPRLFADKIFGTIGTGTGNGVGIGIFYKFGRSLSKNLSITTEIGGMISYDHYGASYGGPIMWESGYTLNAGLYRGNISLNYHF
jgi:hypothetical protein